MLQSQPLPTYTPATTFRDIADLYLPLDAALADDKVRGFSQQILLHQRPGMTTKPTRIPNVRLWTRGTDGGGDRVIQQVDQLWVLAIPDLDHTFGLTEYIPQPKVQPSGDISSSIHSNDSEPILGNVLDSLPVDWEGEGWLDTYDDIQDLLVELLA